MAVKEFNRACSSARPAIRREILVQPLDIEPNGKQNGRDKRERRERRLKGKLQLSHATAIGKVLARELEGDEEIGFIPQKPAEKGPSSIDIFPCSDKIHPCDISVHGLWVGCAKNSGALMRKLGALQRAGRIRADYDISCEVALRFDKYMNKVHLNDIVHIHAESLPLRIRLGNLFDEALRAKDHGKFGDNVLVSRGGGMVRIEVPRPGQEPLVEELRPARKRDLAREKSKK
ncbi:Uncharacterised protein [uncultured archaeon]|nr:Uncharacterised protein [uncultured archaeon]